MSKFLAPIHTCIFNKIKLYENLEANLVKAYTKQYGQEACSLYNEIKEKYGTPLEDRPIEELIDVSNIHGWLQNKISITESRQAELLTKLINKYCEEVKNIALKLYAQQGSKCGKEAKEKYDATNASTIYKALNDYILEGMPCDRVNSITENTEDKLEWENEMCLHKGYWDAVSGDVKLFYELRDAWIKSFVENINDNFSYIPYRDMATFEIIKNQL
ncbi:hypothetical protein [Candidatus Clostridium radicumherbarum]|uniref:Uncharacterized protein n=1 Tax=Candidatus Clostridium radicumherbarum TaxID=3381662 RepID=A0ABW8TVE1_9CLOT